jgi:signal recognition particle receptor subunit beta
MLEDATGIKVDVIGGAVRSDEDADPGSGVRRWEEWIGSCL